MALEARESRSDMGFGSYFEVSDLQSDIIQSLKVFGLSDSLRAAKFSMLADPSKADEKSTPGIMKLFTMPSQSGEDSFLSGIIVQADVRATIKFWTEFERYHFADIVMSQSTMHRLESMDLTESFSEYTDSEVIDRLKSLQKKYRLSREKSDFLTLVYSCPAGLKLTARVTTNYRAIKTIYRQRKNHQLPEWRDFCECLRHLPFSDLLFKGL